MSEPIQSIAQNNYILQAPSPSSTMFTTELEYDGDKISGYAGSAFKAGTDLEFGYDSADNISAINNSALTDASLNNLVQTNSGVWGGSALPISAGPGIKVNLIDNTLVFSNDETVLFENWESPIRSTTATGSLSEPLTSFDSFEITWAPWGNMGELRWEPITQKFQSYPASNSASYYTLFAPWIVENNQGMYWFMELLSADDTNFCIKEGKFYQFRDTVTNENTSIDNSKIYKIVGINRK